MSIQLYGIPLSISLRRSLIVIKELNVPYKLVTVDVTKGEHKAESVLKVQPFGQIPFIKDTDNGLELYESRAIARYIVSKYDKEDKSGLLPRGEIAAAKFEQAASLELTKFDPAALGLATELFFKPALFGQETDKAAVEKYLATLNGNLDVYEVILAKQKYLAGDSLTLADLFHLPLGTLLTDITKLDVLTTDKRPNVKRWWTEISTLPNWLIIKADNSPK